MGISNISCSFANVAKVKFGTVQYFVYGKDDMSLSTDVWKKLRKVNPAISLHICG
jgi:hypothetical protein